MDIVVKRSALQELCSCVLEQLPADLVCMALRMEGAVTTNDFNINLAQGSNYVCTTGTLEHLVLSLSASADD